MRVNVVAILSALLSVLIGINAVDWFPNWETGHNDLLEESGWKDLGEVTTNIDRQSTATNADAGSELHMINWAGNYIKFHNRGSVSLQYHVKNLNQPNWLRCVIAPGEKHFVPVERAHVWYRISTPPAS